MFDILKRWDFEKINIDNAKVTLGHKALIGRELVNQDIENVRLIIWEIFKKKSVEKFINI